MQKCDIELPEFLQERSMNVYNDSADPSHAEAKLGKIQSFQATTTHPRGDGAFMEVFTQVLLDICIVTYSCSYKAIELILNMSYLHVVA